MQRYSTLRTCSPQNCQSHQKKSRTKKKEKLKSIKHTQKTIEKIIIETKAGFLKRINIIGKLLPLKKKKGRKTETDCLSFLYLFIIFCLLSLSYLLRIILYYSTIFAYSEFFTKNILYILYSQIYQSFIESEFWAIIRRVFPAPNSKRIYSFFI